MNVFPATPSAVLVGGKGGHTLCSTGGRHCSTGAPVLCSTGGNTLVTVFKILNWILKVMLNPLTGTCN